MLNEGIRLFGGSWHSLAPPLPFVFNITYRTLGHSHLFSEDFDTLPMVRFPTGVLPSF